ncbi:Ribosomal RNA small subunit methyltransferase E, RsmE [Thermobacillus xylanilyticus]|jgi:16S rRNA (uracil1498-N3)-methyltransferase|uniref:Ribosomal RNA small subunit methyltransferase E n=1 Tax=Thermobacillus xylanilyticus TaxID=76633 RepID=A0ABM8V9C6_THEXY|nr:RsmE family RNA methyltransferase [Thermobacillus xylanilyticus]REJ15176.1 MAG: 16S rRNA (uracil(1498)-N(3))-methyltransferase [Paenibacillaceae bacterium]CAG5093324.1 Ribosomal RNA small subunit methyltransferase E, RsmE [Thermobacillus xylanilyticus]
MQRYIVPPAAFRGRTVIVEGDDAFHIARVMRMRPGDRVVVCDGAGREATAVLTEVTPVRAEAEAEELRPSSGEPAWTVVVAQSLPKGDKMELIIQKGTEIGAAAFVPFRSERAVVQYDGKQEAKRLERWRKIAKEAAEQAHRGRLPEVAGVASWRELLQSFAEYDDVYFCYERQGGEPAAGLRTRVRETMSRAGDRPLKLLIVVGPEGGFTEREAAEAVAAGARPAGLGARILRTETAALAALACLMYESGEMGGNE